MNDEQKVKLLYGDILNHPRPQTHCRPNMSLTDRAAQFSPFAALTGYEEEIEEAARRTDTTPLPYEEREEEISDRLRFLAEHVREQPSVQITYFRPDAKKEGGAFLVLEEKVKKISSEEQTLFMTDGTKIRFADLIALEGEIFSSFSAEEAENGFR